LVSGVLVEVHIYGDFVEIPSGFVKFLFDSAGTYHYILNMEGCKIALILKM